MWTRTGLAFKEVQIAEGSSHEVIWLSVRLADGRSVAVCALYRSGSLSGDYTGMLVYEPESIETTLWHIFSEFFPAKSVGMVLKSPY